MAFSYSDFTKLFDSVNDYFPVYNENKLEDKFSVSGKISKSTSVCLGFVSFRA